MSMLTLMVLVLVGEEDDLIHGDPAAHLLSCIPHASTSVYADAGHVPFLEDPECFNQELAMFARENPAQGTRAN